MTPPDPSAGREPAKAHRCVFNANQGNECERTDTKLVNEYGWWLCPEHEQACGYHPTPVGSVAEAHDWRDPCPGPTCPPMQKEQEVAQQIVRAWGVKWPLRFDAYHDESMISDITTALSAEYQKGLRRGAGQVMPALRQLQKTLNQIRGCKCYLKLCTRCCCFIDVKETFEARQEAGEPKETR